MLTATWLRKNGLAIPKDHWLRRGRRFDPIVADRLLWGLGFGPLIAAFVSTVVPMLWIAIHPNFKMSFGLTSGLLIGAVVCMVVGYVTVVHVAPDTMLQQKIETIARHLDAPLASVVNVSRSTLVEMIYRRLEVLTDAHTQVEQRTIPGDSERAESWSRFATAYSSFLGYKLIDDVGYGRFFKKAAAGQSRNAEETRS